jgi:hypothetical protein
MFALGAFAAAVFAILACVWWACLDEN